jgi:putative DNA primase/helicase
MLIIPMKINNLVVGCQTIQPDGTKRFLTGQITKGASFKIGWRGKDIVCEGYATGLSVHRALKFLNKEAKIHVCFSASNMVEVAKGLKDPLVIADNDESETGLRMAKKIGHRYWMSDKVGEDFNDAELRLGTPSVSHSLKNLMT